MAQKIIYKIGGIILRDKKILVVRENRKGKIVFIIPGGRKDGEETHEQTLHRELMEELGVSVNKMEFFGHYEEIAAFENIPIIMDVYMADIEGEPKACSEIKELIWVDKNFADQGYSLGSVLSEHVIPALVSKGLM